jgi:hypothetical protein
MQFYGAMKATEAKRLRELEQENIPLKRLLADTVRVESMLKGLRRTLLSPKRRRRAVYILHDRFRVSQRRAGHVAH